MSEARQTTADLPRAALSPLPLKLWIVIGILCLLALAAGVGIMREARILWLENLEARAALDGKAFSALPPPGERPEPVVIVVGNSLMRAAIGTPERLRAR